MSDRLSELLPVHIRKRDAETGGALRALLAVLSEQVDLVRDDIEQLYDNWFIETSDRWAVPYLADLVGYELLRGYEEALAAGGPSAAALAARLAPRRDVASTVANRRRKGTLPLLEELASAVADWPARAVEFHRLLVRSQPIKQYGSSSELAGSRPRLGYVDVRRGDLLDFAGGPFDPLGHGSAAARVTSSRRLGDYRVPNVGLFVWRLKPYSITRAPAYCVDRARNLFTFSILGNDVPLVTKPVAEPGPSHIATEANVPAFISRRVLDDRLTDYYGPDKSFTIWRHRDRGRDGEVDPIPLSDIVVTDLSNWTYRARRGQVLVDPELGRIAFGPRSAPRRGVWVTYHYAFSDDLGGGEYWRGVTTAGGAKVYRVGPGEEFDRIGSAYEAWQRENEHGDQPEAVIEITHSGAYQEQLEFVLGQGDRLELRAAEGTRPVLRLLDWYSNRPDSLQIRGNPPSEDDDRPPGRFTIDGLLITGRGVSVTGALSAVVLRHSTLVPGWSLEPRCKPTHPEEPSLVLENTSACVQIERSILGTILVINDEVRTDPIPLHLADSILDATESNREALSAPECQHAHAILHAHRVTVIGEVHTHAVALGENSIFDGRMHVARRGVGCLRFCYVQPGSRTPRRYHCEPDLVWAALRALVESGDVSPSDLARLRELEAFRVRPQFTSQDYGTPAYLQLSRSCAAEITRGAEDGAELGAFHDLFQPQREDNLRARLEEFSPAGSDAGILFVS